MLNSIKDIIISILGRGNTKRIFYFISGKKVPFDESDLILNYFNKFPRKGIMIDVGVHYGESCLPYGNKGWKIWGFEPDSNNRKKIPVIRNLKLYDNAVSDKDGEVVSFYGSNESSGISSLSAFTDSHVVIGQVETKTLRTVVSEEGLDRVDFLKIDIEGYDLFALKGFPFDVIKPEIIICEFEDYKTMPLGYSYHDLGNFLVSKGYAVYLSEWSPIIAYGVKHTWKHISAFPSQLQNENGWGNFIAVAEYKKPMFEEVLNGYLKSYQ